MFSAVSYSMSNLTDKVCVITPENTEGGNTKTPSSPIKKNRKWVFTLNNYSEEEFTQIHKVFVKKGWTYIIGKEVGKQGTPHLQGYLRSANAILFTTLKKLMPRAHLEVAKGSDQENLEYCSKEADFITNIVRKVSDGRTFQEQVTEMVIQDEYADVKWRDWQWDILDILDGPVDGRRVHWFWEETGNVGKSYLAKFIAMRDDVIICDGKKDNVFNQVNMMLENEKLPRVVLLDMPRSALSHVNYGAIEQLKNGCMYSGKYEGGKCIFPRPHVICFANVGPKLGEMSEDRWDIHKICVPDSKVLGSPESPLPRD